MKAAHETSPRRVGSLSMAIAAAIGLSLVYPVWLASTAAAKVMFGRDQGIYQFAAWALSRGARDYVDIYDINGPLTHGVHQLFLALGGSDEHRFHVIDLVITGASFAIAGACLPGLTRDGDSAAPSWWERLAWAFAAWATLSVQYLSYDYWDIAQRESFCDWLLLPSVGLQLLVQGNAALARRPRLRAALLVIAGASSVLPWFIKPSYVICSLLQCATLFWISPRAERRPRLGIFLAGIGVGLALELAWLAKFASVSAMLRAYFWEAPRMYGPIWHVTPGELLLRRGFPNWSWFALVVALLVGVLIRYRLLPMRALLLALLPVAGVLHVLAQGKGFPYHYHLMTSATVLAALGAVCGLAERWQGSRSAVLLGPPALTLFGAAVLIALLGLQLRGSPYVGGRSRVFEGNSFDRPRFELGRHFFYMRFNPWDLGEGARYIQTATAAGSSIFLYGTSPYLLFLSQRDAATRFIYAHQLNVDAAIDGRSSSQIYKPGIRLSESRAAELTALRDRNAALLLADIKRTRPAAAVFTDNEAFLSLPDAWADFKLHNPEAADWIAAHYREEIRFGTVRVWMRRP